MTTGQVPQVRKTRDEVFQARMDRLNAEQQRYLKLAGDINLQMHELAAEWEAEAARRG